MYGERLREARKMKDYTLVKVALLMNTTHATISRYETETLEPSIDMLKKLCTLYKVSADYIIGLTNDIKKEV